jgi:16S rRNA (cytosine967-C5)-methyltransferase
MAVSQRSRDDDAHQIGVAPRRGACALLIEVFERRKTLDEAMRACADFTSLQGHDRAFARAIASIAIRRRGALEFVVSQFLQKPLPESASWARIILLAGAAELLLLSTPDYAAVNAAVALANGRARPFAKLINAVLRKLAEKGPGMIAATPADVELPLWLWTRWRAAFGNEIAAQLAKAHKNQPSIDLTIANPAEAEVWAAKLGGAIITPGSVRLPPEHEDITTLEGFEDGAWWVQDCAATLPARLFGDPAGMRILDLCAAPGGKTMQLAAAGAIVTAVDRSGKRLEQVTENLARTKLQADIVEADGAVVRFDELFDAVLVDAPCTATGTLRRHPEAAWIKSPEDVAALQKTQARLLRHAISLTRPGGTIVYCVCSLEPEEGPDVAAQVLAGGAVERSAISAEDAGPFAECLLPDGDLRVFPFMLAEQGGCDGFYMVRLKRV